MQLSNLNNIHLHISALQDDQLFKHRWPDTSSTATGHRKAKNAHWCKRDWTIPALALPDLGWIDLHRGALRLHFSIFCWCSILSVLTLGGSGWIRILTDTETQEIWEPRCACSMWRCYTDSLTARRLVNERARACRCSPRPQVATGSNLLRLAQQLSPDRVCSSSDSFPDGS